jgi:glutaredoxin 3
MYTTRICPYCQMAKRLLQGKGVTTVQELRIDEDAALREAMTRETQRRTVPQIFIGDTHVGGFDDLAALERAGKLDPLLKS